ncbi:MAG TPA: LacI family DNA-binding transcriptional regulator [Spirochaetia bacterium]|nr:LacI family DNA-binding transcriptional regulator [Spirochaetia bacterium]
MTIKDIAEMAHVSKGTVSRVINGVPGVGDDTRRRVLKLIESLDFHPNASARGLAARKTNTMGFVIPHTGKYTLTSTFWPVFLTVVTQEAAARGINVLLSTARSEDDVDSAFRSILRGRRIDGAIIGAEQFGEKQLAELLVKNLPFVMMGRSSRISTHYVDVDNSLGARMAAEHLAAQGHERLAVLAGPDTLPYVSDRVSGARDACRERGLPDPVVVHSPYETLEAARCVEGLLLSRPAVTGVFVAAGDLVLGTLRACAELRRSVPQDLSIVSFDDHPFFEHLAPGITAVAQPIEEIGAAAVDMLLALMAGREPERTAMVIPPRLVERGSVAGPGVAARTSA